MEILISYVMEFAEIVRIVIMLVNRYCKWIIRDKKNNHCPCFALDLFIACNHSDINADYNWFLFKCNSYSIIIFLYILMDFSKYIVNQTTLHGLC